jgi:hypothetical protein
LKVKKGKWDKIETTQQSSRIRKNIKSPSSIKHLFIGDLLP